MNAKLLRTLCVCSILLLVGGCASQPGRSTYTSNPFCALAGGVVGGGTAAAITIAAGPIAGGVVAGALLAGLLCEDGATTQKVAVETHQAQVRQTPAPVAATTTVIETDSDGDGVIDRLDLCPDTPAGRKVDSHGCPDLLLTLTGVNFKFDSSAIEPASVTILDQAVAALAKVDVAVRIEGHTDSTGTDAYNQKLSERRALAVHAYMTAHGVAAARLSTVGRGESQPVASNDNADGRFQNRRVEFHVAGEAPAASARPSSRNDSESWKHLDQAVTR